MKHIEELTQRYIDGDLDIQEVHELERLLLQNKEARDLYRSVIGADAAMEDLAENIVMQRTLKENKKRQWAFPVFAFSTIAALLVALIVLANTSQNTIEIPPQIATSATPADPVEINNLAIGVVSKAFNTDSEDGRIIVGTPLQSGSFELAQGIVQLEFTSGAIMVVEGPANLEILNNMEVLCERGKISVDVPDVAHGFSVKSKDIHVRDLGTAFTMQCSAEGSKVVVTEGKVELLDQQKIVETLEVNQAREWKDKNSIKPTSDIVPAITHQELDAYVTQHHTAAFERWQQHQEDLRERDDLVLLYGFQPRSESARTIQNQAEGKRNRGAIVGADWVQGRWHQKNALKFKGVNDRIRLNLPQTYDSMTMTAWVRIDSLDQWLSSLLLTDHYKRGALHWQLSDDGELVVGMRSKERQNLTSKKIIGPENLGQWIFLAMTYDADRKRVSHYLNGKKVATALIKNIHPIRLGMCEIGNWSNGKSTPVRGFNGAIDEFAIFSSALTGKTIREHYKSGRP